MRTIGSTLAASVAMLGLSIAACSLAVPANADTLPGGGAGHNGGMGGGAHGGGGMGGGVRSPGAFGGSSAPHPGGVLGGAQFRGGQSHSAGAGADHGQNWRGGGDRHAHWRGGDWNGNRWGPGYGWGPFAGGLAAGAILGSGYPYDTYAYGDGDDYDYDNSCVQFRPIYDQYGQFIARRAVNVCP